MKGFDLGIYFYMLLFQYLQNKNIHFSGLIKVIHQLKKSKQKYKENSTFYDESQESNNKFLGDLLFGAEVILLILLP